jgi:hypothetical protein
MSHAVRHRPVGAEQRLEGCRIAPLGGADEHPLISPAGRHGPKVKIVHRSEDGGHMATVLRCA